MDFIVSILSAYKFIVSFRGFRSIEELSQGSSVAKNDPTIETIQQKMTTIKEI